MSVMAPVQNKLASKSIKPLTPTAGEAARTPFEQSFRNHFLETLLSNDESTGICALRHQALSAFEAQGFPTRKNEAWKYLALSPLLNQAFIPFAPAATLIQPEAYFLSESDGARLVFANGRYQAALSDTRALPEGVIFCDLPSALSVHQDLAASVLDKNSKNDDAFAMLNTVGLEQGLLLHVPENSVLQVPLQILYLVDPQPAQSQDNAAELANFRMVFSLGKNSRAVVTVQTVSSETVSSLYFNNFVHDIVAAESAHLNLSWIQLEAPTAWQFSNARVHLEEASQVTINHVDLGAAVARHSVVVKFAAEKAHCELNGLNVLKGKSEVYQNVVMDHAMPNNTSEQFYKSILDDQTRSEFNGTVKVALNANGTDSHQLTKNLLLSEDARAFARPQLQILADDVKCNHGATVGQLEPSQLFYLKSRGLDPELAESLLMYGFAEEMIEKLPVASLRKYLDERLLSQLKQSQIVTNL
ncbi:MAG: Fe-S cluster assembly protein SufD [Vampirovibrionales bacterium]|nr:Fe-S cluster assembly protein SufD [Vampirovibrionales bacterium]